MTNFESFKMVSTINLTKGSSWKAVLILVISGLSLYSCKKAGPPDGVLSKEDRPRGGGRERWRRDRGPGDNKGDSGDNKDNSGDNNADQQ